ncbi:MAG: DUF1207 domain-containing protein [Gemmatimonadetes bacterium]|nr:DUF1207 domain-containing protein [Gemmatimonadota bacterium]
MSRRRRRARRLRHAACIVPGIAAWVVTGGATPGRAEAQSSRFLPAVHRFERLIADPFEPRLGIGIVHTNVLATQGPERAAFTRPTGSAEVQAIAAIGGTVALVQVAEGRAGGLVIAAQAGVLSRFRISEPSRDDLGQDWIVAMPVELRWYDITARVRLAHRSAHLGDEFAESSGARRIEFGGESVDALMGWYVLDRLRVYGGGGWIFHSNTDNTDVLRREQRPDRFTIQAGVDGELTPWRDDRWSLIGGIDFQSAERTDWTGALAAAAGVRATSGARGVRLLARYLDGKSPLGQFFLTREQYWSLELVIDF